MRSFVLLLLLVAVAACDSGEADPPPGAFPLIELADVATEEPGRYNVQGYIAEIQECPPDAFCIIGDHLTVTETPTPDGNDRRVMIMAEQPSRLDLGAYYLLSVELTGNGETRVAQLIDFAQAVSL